MRFKIFCFYILVISGLTHAQHVSTESVLKTGTWKKVCVTGGGVYKMDQQFFQGMGFSVSSIDPKKIKVYGSGAGMLPQKNSDFRYDGLYENAIFVSGEGDGSFDASDYVLFHGEGPHITILNEDGITHERNHYSTRTCYFVTVDGDDGKRIESVSSNASPETTYSSFDEYKWNEYENKNVLTSGREWFGDELRGGYSLEKTLQTPGKVSGTNYEVIVDVMAMARGTASSFDVSLNNTSVADIAVSAAPDVDYGVKGRNSTGTYDFNSSSSSLKLDLVYNNGGQTDAKGYIDYFAVRYKRSLSQGSSALFFQVLESSNYTSVGYNVSGGSNGSMIWDVSHGEDPVSMTFTNNSGVLSFVDETNAEIKKYVVFNPSTASTPSYVGGVSNQNLHGQTTAPDLLIVTHSNFMDQALELAEHRRNHNGYNVLVVSTNQIYNEFSSGVQDLSAIRDFAKMLYDRNTSENSLRYLLLFGDASYDYLDIDSDNSNFVPVYESRESLNNIRTYSSDDFFGFLEDNEGEWGESSSGNHTLDIGVGRLMVQTTSQAATVVDKLIAYDQLETSQGKWRNRIAFVADDGDSDLHMKDADAITTYLSTSFPEYLSKKIYLGSYEQESSSGGEVAPALNTAIDEQVQKGVLVVNYTGHGGELGWAQEKIMTNSMINEYDDNMDNLPLIVTATCEFGRYDDPERSSGAENFLLKDGGGAIGLVTTTRPVYAYSNKRLANTFYQRIFAENDDHSKPALGDVLRLTKNNSFSGVNNRNFSLLGDPSMVLAYPEKEIHVTAMNNEPISGNDTIGALEVVKLEGLLTDPVSGDTLDDFNGVLFCTVLDKPTAKVAFDASPGFAYETQESVLFDGKADVVNGRYELEFILPKDIDYTLGNGKISLYAISDDYQRDANGVFEGFVIGGSSNDIVVDDTPPTVEMYLNDTTFRDGGAVQEEALFIAHVFDENGINTSNSGIGHEIILMIDGNSDDVIVLNEFYEATKNTYKGGTVSYDLSDLPEGNHYLVFRVWDTYNNSTTDTLNFIIGDPALLSISNNPFDDETQIDILQQRAGEPLDVLVEIFNVSGMLVWVNEYSYDVSPATIEDIKWDGTSSSRSELPSGAYIIRLVLTYPSDGYTVVKSSKLVLID